MSNVGYARKTETPKKEFAQDFSTVLSLKGETGKQV